MPLCEFVTNIPDKELPGNLHVKLGELLSEALGKPPERLSLTVTGGARMWRAGEDPMASLNIWSFAVFGDPAKNAEYSRVLNDFVVKELAIPAERLVIIFNDVPPTNVGYKGTIAAPAPK
ncbi:PREDICTED: MIF-like protein mif-2 [Priapulus caudatus]|uniref:D-dopachrome decarboxylase n=1 Tax=Priapulus caudatus TaxID=37621 RepID=A0ABM1EQS6_PRICU|nr:PREDICTED: MIF-like protein mif-2 [Priapulus caudatus]XP_014674546.1 PREDICTED: MIF-like protein mif-2 [Priapulus caudatus]XP_014674547.1 PREDICTED: MIF-like protein mif-2 [Priapulus caudatus]